MHFVVISQFNGKMQICHVQIFLFFKGMKNRYLNVEGSSRLFSQYKESGNTSLSMCCALYTVKKKKKINVAESPRPALRPPQRKKRKHFACLGNVCVCILFPFYFHLGGYNQRNGSLFVRFHSMEITSMLYILPTIVLQVEAYLYYETIK